MRISETELDCPRTNINRWYTGQIGFSHDWRLIFICLHARSSDALQPYFINYFNLSPSLITHGSDQILTEKQGGRDKERERGREEVREGGGGE